VELEEGTHPSSNIRTRATPPFQLFPKGIESFLGGVKGGDSSLLQYWNEGYAPFPTFPQRQKEKRFSYPVISSEARNLLSSVEMGNSPPELPPKET